jgi:hypothetical protein
MFLFSLATRVQLEVLNLPAYVARDAFYNFPDEIQPHILMVFMYSERVLCRGVVKEWVSVLLCRIIPILILNLYTTENTARNNLWTTNIGSKLTL